MLIPEWLHICNPSIEHEFPFPHMLHQYLLSVVFMILDILTGVRWKPRGALICIFLIVKDSEHFLRDFLLNHLRTLCTGNAILWKYLSHSKRLGLLQDLTARVNNAPWGHLRHKTDILLSPQPVCLTCLYENSVPTDLNCLGFPMQSAFIT